MIRRLKSAGCRDDDLVAIFISLIRSVLETACPVFHPQLTQENKDDIERVQKIACKIILGPRYDGYTTACDLLGLETLDTRREKLCLNFGLKAIKNKKHQDMFPRDERVPGPRLQTDQLQFLVPLARTARYEKSPIPYIATLLNEHLFGH